MTAGKILIAGAGASGSVIGGMLRAAGHTVTMLGRRRHLNAIARGGLKVSGIFGDRIAEGFSLCDDATSLAGQFDVILVTVKTYDTASMARTLEGRLADDGIVVSMQNGLGNIEMLAEVVGPGRVLGARVIFGSEIVEPGAVRVTVIAEPVAVGPSLQIHRANREDLFARASLIAQMLAEAGIPAEAVPDITPVLWTKLLYNVALNPLGALLKTHYGAVGEDRELRKIIEHAVNEAFAVARRLDVPLPFANAAGYLDHFYSRLLPPTFHHRPSMLYDLENRGRTEIDALNGRVVELADGLKLAAETNRMLTGLIKASEKLQQAKLRGAS